MKLLTVTIPCYNSQEYMSKAIDSVLVCKDDVEIIIVDDGSTDNTLKIAREYELKYPTSVRVIHKENGGHGSALNTGIKNATGIYFKVLDSDDWFDQESFISVIDLLREMVHNGEVLDMLITNYVYEKPFANKQKQMNYFGAVPRAKIISWNKIMHFRITQNLLMHSIIYRTKLLIDCGLELPEHTFYVDNIYAFYPLPYVHKFYYLDVDLYRYFIGRPDQSVNEEVMTRRIDQQIKVTKLMIQSYDSLIIKEKKLKNYMIQYLSVMLLVTSALLINEGSDESIRKRDELWQDVKKHDLSLYYTISRLNLGYTVQYSSKFSKNLVIKLYHVLNKIYGFN